MDCGSEEPHGIPAFRPSVGREWDVVRSVAVEAHQTDGLVATVEGDPGLPRRDYLVFLLSFAGIMGRGKEAGEGVWASRFPRELLAPEQDGPGEPVAKSSGAGETR